MQIVAIKMMIKTTLWYAVWALMVASPVTALASSPVRPMLRRSATTRPSSSPPIRPSLTLHLAPSLHTAVAVRGGAVTALTASPQALFHAALVALGSATVVAKLAQRATRGAAAPTAQPAAVQSLQKRFLAVFWLLRCSDWLQGPYFYEVYASKMVHGASASLSLVSRLFLTGFASTAVFGPYLGRASDAYGRKLATLAFCVIYAAGAWSTKSSLLWILFAGRVLSGIGTSLLFSAPESWLVGQAQKEGSMEALGETFGLAYAGDSIVAILAGQMASLAAGARGPTGPFELSTAFLAAGGLLAAVWWKENKAESIHDEKPSIADAIDVIRQDPKIMLVGGVQSLFEAAMYIFVLQWPPAMAKAIAKSFGGSPSVPYGTIFSCFMASCLLGSTLFGQLTKWKVRVETSTTAMLAAATSAMTVATLTVASSSSSLAALVAAFFCFEACVGMYFPSIGTLRSKYVPDSHRGVIMNLFGIPLNVLVVSVFMSIGRLGVKGALSISSTALALATVCMFGLQRQVPAAAS